MNRTSVIRFSSGSFMRIHILAILSAASLAHAQNDPRSLPEEFRLLYRTDFNSGIDKKLDLQGARTDSLTVVDAPGGRSGKALRATMEKGDDFSHVANKVPRVEIGFGHLLSFQMHKDYLIRWGTYIPEDYQFDSKQPEGITQIHEGVPKGTPPFSITLVGSHYQVDLRNGDAGPHSVVFHDDIGSADQDRGKWVNWTLHYLPDAGGTDAKTELYKNDNLILNRNGKPNAYLGDDRAYFKMGIYKWWWQQRPSDVTTRTLYFGDVSIGAKE